MSVTASSPLPALVEPSEYSRYLVTTPAEVRAVLRQLVERRSQITVFSDAGQNLLLTAVIEVREHHLVLDYGAQAEANRKALAAPRHFCVTQCEGVRIQFLIGTFTTIEWQGAPAFLAELPREILRLQRRDYYRLATPVAPPVRCLLPIPLPDGGLFHHEAQVSDLSLGGVCLEAPPSEIPFAEGMTLSGCRLDLPEVGSVSVSLTVRHLREVKGRWGTQRRAGCAFAPLPAADEGRIQRYILKIERQRKARAAGLR